MSEKSAIEWTEATWNPVHGVQRSLAQMRAWRVEPTGARVESMIAARTLPHVAPCSGEDDYTRRHEPPAAVGGDHLDRDEVG
jgi:protein gp37